MGIPNHLLDPLKDILLYNRRRIYIDNLFFRLHYVWTVIFLIAFALIITSKIYIGEPINCQSSADIKDIVTQYCFIHSTFTRGKLDKKAGWIYQPLKENEIYPGVGPGLKDEEIISHSYYQWVWCMLSLQAAAFYFPHWAWQKMEKGTTMMLVGDLNLPMLPDEKKSKHRKKILNYLKINRGTHCKYAANYILCELLNLSNILIQILATNYFVQNEFTTLGLKIFSISDEKPYLRDDALARVFPTVTACRFSTGGVAFGKVNYDVLCVLSINIINEKIYIFLWFWFLVVLVGTVYGLVYRLLTLSVTFRKHLLKYKLRIKTQKESVDNFCDGNNYGEWFLLYKLGQNMDTVTFGDLIEDVQQAYSKWDEEKDEMTCLSGGCAPTQSNLSTPIHHKLFIA